MPAPPLRDRPVPAPIKTAASLRGPALQAGIESDLTASLGWTADQPNAEPLWAEIRLAASNYLMELFRRGSFAGTKPADAFFVQCGAQTTTQTDIENGIVNLRVGFAPLKPAEFTTVTIRLRAATVR
jgi:phage tail sheath protein FI